MIIQKLYHDICQEIHALEERIKDLEGEFTFWYWNCFGYGRKVAAPLDVCIERMNAVCNQVELYSELLEKQMQSKENIERRLSKLQGLEGKVMYLRVVEGLSLKEIADKLGFSVIWIKKISSRSQKKIAV